jgi:3-dehydroquinate synthase
VVRGLDQVLPDAGMNPVSVRHTRGEYSVYVESGALGRLEALVRQHLPARRVAMVADNTVYDLYRAGHWGASDWTGETLTFPAGEQSKTRETWARLTDGLLDQGIGRDGGIVALGGGVTGDLAGFVAATYMRGLPYVQVPTTLLAMLDASVGGKTGVDTDRGKNLVGSFHPPAAVIADPLVLRTLPERDYRAGFSEAVKHGLILDREYFQWIEAHASELTARDSTVLTTLIRRSVELKAQVVGEDEHESGRRAILNAGHTIAHALERMSDYQLPHGEAVALGLMIECRLAEHLGVAVSGLHERVARLLTRLGLPHRLPSGFTHTALINSMTGDKKNRSGHIHFALPGALGRMHQGDGWTIAVPDTVIHEVLTLGTGD